MRTTLIVLLLLLSAPALHAQAGPLSVVEPPRLQQVAEPLPRASEEEPVAAAALHQQGAAGETGAAEPLFDRAFWRSVLAGVIASVLTAMILRVLL